MICRGVLKSMLTVGSNDFDFFNDYRDTHNYLLREAQCNEDPIVRNDAAELAELLTKRYQEYIYTNHTGRLS